MPEINNPFLNPINNDTAAPEPAASEKEAPTPPAPPAPEPKQETPAPEPKQETPAPEPKQETPAPEPKQKPAKTTRSKARTAKKSAPATGTSSLAADAEALIAAATAEVEAVGANTAPVEALRTLREVRGALDSLSTFVEEHSAAVTQKAGAYESLLVSLAAGEDGQYDGFSVADGKVTVE